MPTQKPNIVYILADDMGYGDVACNNPESKIPTPNLDRMAAAGMRFTDAHAASSVCTPSRYSILTGRYCWRTDLKNHVLWPWDRALIEPDRLTVAHLLRDNGYRTAAVGKWHLGWDWQTKDGSDPAGGLPIGMYESETRKELEANIDFTKPMRGGPVDCGFDSYFGIDVPNFTPYTWFEDDHLAEIPTEPKADHIFGTDGVMIPGWEHERMIPEFVRRVEKYIDNADDDPFFLYFALTSPHTPICPNKEFIGKSGAGLFGDFVCEVDWVVGKVLDALKAKGILDETLVIFTTDNGPEPLDCGYTDCGAYEHARLYGHYSMGELRGVKRDSWEGGHRVPFIAHWPDVVPAGSVCNQLAGLSDLLGTCADLLDVELPADTAEDTISILPLLEGKDETPFRTSMIHHTCFGKFALRKDNWVFIDHVTGDDCNTEPEWFKEQRGYKPHNFPGELYDLQQDLSERENLYGQHPEIVEAMRDELREFTKEGESVSHTTKESEASE